MSEIKCPKCGEHFKISEASFADIVKQVRDSQFEEELNNRVETAVNLAVEKTKNASNEDIGKIQAALVKAEAEKERILAELKSAKDTEIAQLEAKIKSSDTEKKLAVTEAVSAEAKKIAEATRERDELKIQIANNETEKQSMKNRYEEMLKYKDAEMERIRSMKIELSTKGVGESLEQFCQDEFNKIRAAAFSNAFFGKDNDASADTKGDFIFRYPADGVESISIMFEMKNESEETSQKQKNESFFAKLDKDRNTKKCEYAILVSTLEADSDLYNQGIVDVSHVFPKMYVVRPQFFIPMITLLKNAAEKSLETKNELAIIKSQNIDITTFEDDVNRLKNGFNVTVKNAINKHHEAIGKIDKAIEGLVKAREALTMSDKHLITAENKMDDFAIKRLTRKNPTMAKKFEELKTTESEG